MASLCRWHVGKLDLRTAICRTGRLYNGGNVIPRIARSPPTFGISSSVQPIELILSKPCCFQTVVIIDLWHITAFVGERLVAHPAIRVFPPYPMSASLLIPMNIWTPVDKRAIVAMTVYFPRCVLSANHCTAALTNVL